MFFVTLKFTKRTAVAIILGAALILIALVLIFGGEEAAGVFGSGRIDSREERVEYLEGLGWEVEPDSETEKDVLIPREFTGVYLEYNRLQKQQGFDLEEFLGTELEMYSYIVTNYQSDDTVVATLYIYRGAVVGGDVHSTSLGGFMHGLK